ncbi:MAG: hypothetical protein SFV18_16300 [Bryobacteraceae bacterium]|nr:hypothetical protein [Bryobacteraceae bacterium]
MGQRRGKSVRETKAFEPLARLAETLASRTDLASPKKCLTIAHTLFDNRTGGSHMGLPLKKESYPAYPKTEIRATVKEWWRREQDELQKLADPVEELQPENGTVFDLVPMISSHHAVEIVLALEDIVGFEIPDSVIKRGGYHSCEEMVEHLERKLADLHSKKYPT